MDVELIILNNEEWSEQIVTGSFDTEAILGYNSGWLDPDDLFYNRYYSESTTNRLNVNDPQLDEWILAGRTELDPQKRRAIYDQMQIYLAEKQYTWIVPTGPTTRCSQSGSRAPDRTCSPTLGTWSSRCG